LIGFLLLVSAKAGQADPLSSLLGGSANSTLQIVVLLTALTVLPAVLVSVTPFLRLTVVLHFLRQALGTQSVPSNQVLLGLSLFLTIVVMQPIAAEAYQQGWVPYEAHRVSGEQAWEDGTRPVRGYLLRFCREKDLSLILEVTKTPPPKKPEELGLRILAPAYVLSELRASFQIGAVLFLPFLIIDLVVASLTLSIGMVQLPPAMISAPFKILLFVLVDGWNLVVGSLLKSVS
jgi:flagellar biosynthetic protein FliP